MAQQAVSRREHKERGDDGSKQRGKEGLGCGAVDASCREDPCPFQWTGQFRAPALKEALLGLEPLRRNERQCLLLLYKCPDQGSQTGMHAEHKSLDFPLLSSGAGGRRGQWMGLRLGGAVSFLSCVALGAAYVGFLCAVRCRATACMVVGRADVGLSEKTVRWRWCVEGRMPS